MEVQFDRAEIRAAGVDFLFKDASRAYHELEGEGKLKIRSYSYLMVEDNAQDPEAVIARIDEERSRYFGEYYSIIGAKVFLDGAVEAHAAWMLEDYADQAGYTGVERFNDHEKMVALIVAADRRGLCVHAHSIGDGATKFMLDCIEDAQRITGDRDQRNIIAHLAIVRDEDVRRMAETGTVAAVAPLWVPKGEGPGGCEMEVRHIGEERAEGQYPIRSFFDAGANVVFHSDYPASPMIDSILNVYMADTRGMPCGGDEFRRNPGEGISRGQSLRAMTINVARQWRQEHRLGSIECGKVANMSVFDRDLLHDDIERVAEARVVATIVDGEVAYRA